MNDTLAEEIQKTTEGLVEMSSNIASIRIHIDVLTNELEFIDHKYKEVFLKLLERQLVMYKEFQNVTGGTANE